MLILICADHFCESPSPTFRCGPWKRASIFGVLKPLDCSFLAGALGERPPFRWFGTPEWPQLAAPKLVLSRHPFRGGLVGLISWHPNIVSANQD